METPAAASKASDEEGEIDVEALLKERDRIKTLMRRDPRFITRLIAVGCGAAAVMVGFLRW